MGFRPRSAQVNKFKQAWRVPHVGGGHQVNKCKKVHMTRQGDLCSLSPLTDRLTWLKILPFLTPLRAVATNKFPVAFGNESKETEWRVFPLSNETPTAIYSFLDLSVIFLSFDRWQTQYYSLSLFPSLLPTIQTSITPAESFPYLDIITHNPLDYILLVDLASCVAPNVTRGIIYFTTQRLLSHLPFMFNASFFHVHSYCLIPPDPPQS